MKKLITKYQSPSSTLPEREYLPEYEYEFGIIDNLPNKPKNQQFEPYVQAEKHKRITNEQDWQNYWGNQGAASVSSAMNQAGLKLMPYALGLANPLTFTYGMIGGEVFDDGTRAASNGKYQDWGSMVSDKTGMNQIVSQMTNPGYLIGGAMGESLRFSPTTGMNSFQETKNLLGRNINNYRQVIPRFINLAKNFNGANRTSRAITNGFHIFKSPKYIESLAKSPELIGHINLYEFKNFTPNQIQQFQKVWANEATKGLYSRNGELRFATSPEYTNRLPELFNKGRTYYQLEELGERYGKTIGNSYQRMRNEITDPDLLHIIDESPQYTTDIYNWVKNGSGSKENFIKKLINQSNSYRRFMSADASPEEFGTFKGGGLHNTGTDKQINVEGELRSDWNGEYGSYPAYFEGKPELNGEVSTWWDQRIPKNVNVTSGMHTRSPYIRKLFKKLNKIRESDYFLPIGEIESRFNIGARNASAPGKFVYYPVHQVFYGPKGTKLPNFKITTGRMPEGFTFGKGYKQGGKLLN